MNSYIATIGIYHGELDKKEGVRTTTPFKSENITQAENFSQSLVETGHPFLYEKVISVNLA
jgi:hypothetical protein